MIDDTELVLDWLKSTDIALSTIARKSGISRKSLHNWRLGGLPSGQSLKKLTKYYNNIQVNRITSDKTGHIDKDYVIGLQKDRIKQLEARNEKAELENSIWDLLEYNAEFEVELKFEGLKLKRRIVTVSGMDTLSKELGYSVDEIRDNYFCLGEWYEMKKHPIDKIMSKETRSNLAHYTDNFPTLFKAYKTIVGDYYIPFNITYVGKNGRNVQASVYNRVNWRELRVEAKVKMFV